MQEGVECSPRQRGWQTCLVLPGSAHGGPSGQQRTYHEGPGICFPEVSNAGCNRFTGRRMCLCNPEEHYHLLASIRAVSLSSLVPVISATLLPLL